jgi:hypothetical protein
MLYTGEAVLRFEEECKTSPARILRLHEVSALRTGSLQFSLTACTATWTMLAAAFPLTCLIVDVCSTRGIFASPVSVEPQVFSKLHQDMVPASHWESRQVFDESTRAVRQLEELRNSSAKFPVVL